MHTLVLLCLWLAQVPHFDPQTLPNPLKTKAGAVSAAQWTRSHRDEILRVFRDRVYGQSPPRPANLKFSRVANDPAALGGKATQREVDVEFSREGRPFRFRLTLFLPNSRTKPAPVFLLLNHRGTVASQLGQEFFPVEEIVARGYGAAAIALGELSPDDVKTYRNGVIDLYDGPEEKAPNAWRTIAAWAWGGQRAMDYLETDRDVDAKRVAVIGHSRGGKTALWAGAQDQRFALTISNNSGETGAALARRKHGETIAKINDRFPHWFATNYKGYNGNEDELPVDQHELIALLAPRLAYVASAEDDDWADPLGEFLAAVHATPVYRLLGVPGLESNQMPPVEKPLHQGRIGYHIRKGGHGLTLYDWRQFLAFADRHLTAR